MPRLTAACRPVDEARVFRLLLSWIDGDKVALDHVVAEVMRDAVGTPGVMFALTGFAAELAERCVPDARDQLRAALLDAADDAEQP